MAQVVAFPAFAPRTGRISRIVNRADGDTGFGRVIVFTGVWHERVERKDASGKRDVAAGKPKQQTDG